MQNLTLKDTQNLLHDIQELYSLYDLNSFSEKALAIVDRYFNSMFGNELVQENIDCSEIAFDRSQPNFTDRDRLILNLLDSYLFQAYCNARRYNQLQQNLTQLHQSLDCLGLIILNTSGQIQFITSQAREYLQIYFAKPANQLQIPDHLWNWVKYQIAYFTENSDRSNTRLLLRIEQTSKQLNVRLAIATDRDGYLLLLEEQTLSLLSSLKLLGLSPRETEVLYWLIRGKDNRAIARHLNVHISTVRKHLESIFYKLGVQSRTEAIAEVLQKLGILIDRPCFDN